MDSLISPQMSQLISSSEGKSFLKKIGLDAVRNVVLDVLLGVNLRHSTEMLTRRRIGLLNIELVRMFVEGSIRIDDFINNLPKMSSELLKKRRLKKTERAVALWVLGLTDKAFQNVLRDDAELIDWYCREYSRTCKLIAADASKNYGDLFGNINIGSETVARIDWLMLTYLLNTVGSQTLATRGSDKSAYGKLFEKIILGSLLEILGFSRISKPSEKNPLTSRDMVFWLSSAEGKRESDATLLYKIGKGIRFDIGFIGRGNPEISLDKVSRFERKYEFSETEYYMATIIIVDRIGEKSKITELASDINGHIVQMSASYWPKTVAEILAEVLEDYDHELIHMDTGSIKHYLKDNLMTINIESFI